MKMLLIFIAILPVFLFGGAAIGCSASTEIGTAFPTENVEFILPAWPPVTEIHEEISGIAEAVSQNNYENNSESVSKIDSKGGFESEPTLTDILSKQYPALDHWEITVTSEDWVFENNSLLKTGMRNLSENNVALKQGECNPTKNNALMKTEKENPSENAFGFPQSNRFSIVPNAHPNKNISFSLTLPKNKITAVTARPVTKNSDGEQTLFFHPAGTVYPNLAAWEGKKNCTMTLTWENGFTAKVIELVYGMAENSGYSKDTVSEFVARFNWGKFAETISTKEAASISKISSNAKKALENSAENQSEILSGNQSEIPSESQSGYQLENSSEKQSEISSEKQSKISSENSSESQSENPGETSVLETLGKNVPFYNPWQIDLASMFQKMLSRNFTANSLATKNAIALPLGNAMIPNDITPPEWKSAYAETFAIPLSTYIPENQIIAATKTISVQKNKTSRFMYKTDFALLVTAASEKNVSTETVFLPKTIIEECYRD